MTAFMGFPHSDDGPYQSTFLAGNLFISPTFQRLEFIIISDTYNHDRETHQYPTIGVPPPIECESLDGAVVEHVRPLLLMSAKTNRQMLR